MSGDWDDRPWMCGGAGGVNLCSVASIVGEQRARPGPRPAAQGSKMLKPDKWRAAFDSEGKPVGFQKALKRIVLGGVDPSIRAEVWEFLLGCYALGSTAEYRHQLRIARRERYKDLIEQCQMMHSSIGTGSLAYTVGSKVMDVRIMSKDSAKKEAKIGVERVTQEARSKLESYHGRRNDENIEVPDAYEIDKQSSTDSSDFGSARENQDNAALNCFYGMSSAGLDSGICSESDREDNEALYFSENSLDFPHLPVTNLFERREEVGAGFGGPEAISPRQRVMGSMDHNLNIRQNKEEDSLAAVAIHRLETDDETEPSNSVRVGTNNVSVFKDMQNSDNEKVSLDKDLIQEHMPGVCESKYQPETVGRVKISDAPEPGESPLINPVISLGVDVNEERVADWLWTLHRIVVDVVRTDRHLEFYGDAKNMARMSDILAVYAWVDPKTGYCQGMSDLLSPFIVLYEDNADAFWCFESLLRRMRQNFQMEGPVGVMKQLEALGRILQLTNIQLFKHLVVIGAESLLFAFRMLLVLFRRELSFSDALCMWEMMWAADFDEAMAWALETSCLEPLVLRPPRTICARTQADDEVNTSHSRSEQTKQVNADNSMPRNNEVKSLCRSPFCGLKAGYFWPKHSQQKICTMNSLLRKNGDDELSVFCVAAILVLNRSKFIKDIHSMDDAIKMFNDMEFEIRVKSLIQMAIKLRKKYFRKLAKQAGMGRISARKTS